MANYISYILFATFSALVNKMGTLPDTWPSEWNSGIIPYHTDNYCPNQIRLISFIQEGVEFIQKRSCLKFQKVVPNFQQNLTYLLFSYSDSSDDCSIYGKLKMGGARLVVLTPRCNLGSEVAHAILHALGLKHQWKKPIPLDELMEVLFVYRCAWAACKALRFKNSLSYSVNSTTKFDELGKCTLDTKYYRQRYEMDTLDFSDFLI